MRERSGEVSRHGRRNGHSRSSQAQAHVSSSMLRGSTGIGDQTGVDSLELQFLFRPRLSNRQRLRGKFRKSGVRERRKAKEFFDKRILTIQFFAGSFESTSPELGRTPRDGHSSPFGLPSPTSEFIQQAFQRSSSERRKAFPRLGISPRRRKSQPGKTRSTSGKLEANSKRSSAQLPNSPSLSCGIHATRIQSFRPGETLQALGRRGRFLLRPKVP